MASRQNPSLSTTSGVKEKPSHSKPEAKLKHGKVIHKITSESYMRIACDNPQHPSTNAHQKFIDKSSSNSSTSGGSGGANNLTNKRKGASFQITSVSVSSTQHHMGHHRNSTDNNGDDSADDLDDSHTDDNISRITDYETPSISETFSGEDVFFAQQNAAFGTAPVIPTSSQYGLAIVGPDLGGNGSNLTDVHVSVSDACINIMGPISSKQDPDHKNERFKVVKIESTEPFKRGRWMCMDYLDHTTLQAQDDGIDGGSEDTKDDNDETKLMTLNNGEVISDNEDVDHEVNKINSIHHHNEASHHYPATMTSIPITNVHSHHQHVPQSMPHAQIETILTQEKVLHEPPTSHPVQHNMQHAQTMTPEMIHASVMHQEQSQATHNFHQQGVTLPTNIILQNIEQSQQQALNSPNNSSNVALPPTTITLNEQKDVDLQQTEGVSMTSQFSNQQVGDSCKNESDSHHQTLVANVLSNNSDGQNISSSPSSSAGPGTAADGVNSNSNTVVSEINESASNSGNSATAGADGEGQTLNEDTER